MGLYVRARTKCFLFYYISTVVQKAQTQTKKKTQIKKKENANKKENTNKKYKTQIKNTKRK